MAELIKQPVAVEIADAKTFWPAEEYHQDYADKIRCATKFTAGTADEISGSRRSGARRRRSSVMESMWC